MNKLSQIEVKQRNDLIAKLDAAMKAVTDQVETLNAAVTAYNEALQEAISWAEDIGNSIEAYIDEKSENWQESDKGQAYVAWKDAFADWSPDELEEFEAPEPAPHEGFDELPQVPEF